ncbi:MAG: hypothetical protein RSF88_05060 [Lachnospiraceae bacterium]
MMALVVAARTMVSVMTIQKKAYYVKLRKVSFSMMGTPNVCRRFLNRMNFIA